MLAANVSFFSVREDGELRGIAALKQIDERHAELTSMHTAHEARGRGIARALLEHLIAVARSRGYHRVSLETGSMAAFAPARALYAATGFTVCAPFADYELSPHSVFMMLDVGAHA